ncbi:MULTISPECIES: TetR family transcriptional regulator [unclassified Arthrobacter]|uniref:TetR/AcrR family transcriptional regulator n=1 Tax=unclassified Arthrobacter TaxID=235627 RepID=UPI003390ECBA
MDGRGNHRGDSPAGPGARVIDASAAERVNGRPEQVGGQPALGSGRPEQVGGQPALVNGQPASGSAPARRGNGPADPGSATGPGRRGRRGGATESRAQILDTAQRLFAEHGFEGTSLRQIARDAGVDPAMVHHFFRGKDELFALSVALPADPDEVLAGVNGHPPEQRAEAIVRAVLRLWESPAQHSLVAFLRGTIGSKAKTMLLRELVQRAILSRVMAGVPGPPGEVAMRGNLVATQMVGVMLVRYVMRLEPLASASPDDVVRLVAPNVQHYLTGELTEQA